MPGDDPKHDRLGEMLVARGHVTESQLAEAKARQQDRGMPLGQLLVEMGMLSRLQLAGLLTEQWASPAAGRPRPLAHTPAERPPPPATARSPEEDDPPAAAAQPAPVLPIDLRDRLDDLDGRLGRLETAVDRIATRLDDQADVPSRDEVEDLRLALRELWKIQKSLLERDGAAA